AHALWHRHEHGSHAGGSRPAVLRDPRANTPDRGQGAAQAEAPQPQPQAAQLPGYVELGAQASGDQRGIASPLVPDTCHPASVSWSWARSSAGQNAPLITVLSQVRVLPGPPPSPAYCGRAPETVRKPPFVGDIARPGLAGMPGR